MILCQLFLASSNPTYTISQSPFHVLLVYTFWLVFPLETNHFCTRFYDTFMRNTKPHPAGIHRQLCNSTQIFHVAHTDNDRHNHESLAQIWMEYWFWQCLRILNSIKEMTLMVDSPYCIHMVWKSTHLPLAWINYCLVEYIIFLC